VMVTCRDALRNGAVNLICGGSVPPGDGTGRPMPHLTGVRMGYAMAVEWHCKAEMAPASRWTQPHDGPGFQFGKRCRRDTPW